MVGGFVFAIGWVVATALFALYVANFASYSNTYGALGGVVVLMLWFYLTAVMLLLAAELTSLLAKDHAPEHIAARQREIGGAGAGADAAPEPVADRQVVVVEVPRVVCRPPCPGVVERRPGAAGPRGRDRRRARGPPGPRRPMSRYSPL